MKIMNDFRCDEYRYKYELTRNKVAIVKGVIRPVERSFKKAVSKTRGRRSVSLNRERVLTAPG